MPKMNKSEIRKISAKELADYEKSLSNSIAEKTDDELLELARLYSISNMTQMRSAVLYILELRVEIRQLKRQLVVERSIKQPINNLKKHYPELVKTI